ncbi:MAG: serine/threonine-protein kinase, partial [Pyrinomonadaceae bacterium]
MDSRNKIGHFEIMSKIGAGGMGEVYLARDTKLDRKVAIKFLNDEFSTDPEKLNRFIQEAKAASALNHPNIITVFEIGHTDDREYIATEFIDGITLRHRLEYEPLTLVDALNIILQITDALAAAHEAGIIHRDVKPENVMIKTDGRVKVLDFGLAKLAPGSSESVDVTIPQLITRPGVIVGTVAYMSPEQAKGRKIDQRSDIFSLGILMFEMFTGQRPFTGESHLELISSILKDDAPSLRSVAPDLPRQLERIVDKSIRKDRGHRYQHVRDLHIDIEDLRDEIKFESKLSNLNNHTIIAPPQ